MPSKFDPPLVITPYQDLFRWKVDAYPALIYAVCCDMTKSPHGWPKSEGFFFGHDFYWYNNWSDIWSNGDNFIKDYFSGSRGEIPKSLNRKYIGVFRLLRQEVKRVLAIDFANLSLVELRHEWFKFFKIYGYFWFVVTDVEVLSYAASHRLEELNKQREVSLSPEELSCLSAFPEKSYMLEEEYNLLKIALEKSSRRRTELLQQHISRFFWILTGYHGVRLADKKFFVGRLKALIKDKNTPDRYHQLRNHYRETTKRFNQLIKKYKLDQEMIKYAKLAQVSSYIQDQRKALAWHATDSIIKMYSALAKFLGISLEQSLYILWNEFDWALDNKRLVKEISKRQICARLRILGGETMIITKQVGEIFKIFEKEYTKTRSQEIKGIVAYPGRVTGRVQIISDGQKIKNFKTGRILVALMTSPDYILAMKRAKAIVTDDGGLTCHAAIVARELKKTCIVGTRNATRLLKDGDLVTVDANQGTVSKLKKYDR